MENEELEEIFNNADAEFWLQQNETLAEMFGAQLRAFCEGLDAEQARQVIIAYEEWKDAH